ncbi:MAG TPA: hypothetical protein VLH40_06760 [Atribacteraceae bacterium]|nr:hypothetical protein [Atribacteraceae bacterium]
MIRNQLMKLQSEGRKIQLGLCGAGWIGSGFLKAVSLVPGMEVRILADPNPALARQAFLSCGISSESIIETDTPGIAQDAIRQGKYVVSSSFLLPAQTAEIDLIVEASPSPGSGAEAAQGAISQGKNIVMINIEADVTVGRILHHCARKNGVLYTVSSGDEPGCLMELYDFVTTLGYEPIAIGKGKNNPLDLAATPDTVAESARKSNKDPYQVASYVDGTKTMFEMACVANALGFVPIRQGMVGPEADLATVSQVFALHEDGGISPHPGIVDFVQGPAMSGGVFITVRITDPRIREDLQYLKVGKGNYFTFFRPYHLWFLEAPLSVARAYLYREPTLQPLPRAITEVVTIAKKNLANGETLDTFGGYTFSGMIDRAEKALASNALPVGLAPGAVLKKVVNKGELITWDDVILAEDSTVVKLRREQDALL